MATETVTRKAIEQLQQTSRRLRNQPMDARCAKALNGDPSALASITHIILHHHDFPRGPYSAAERAWTAKHVDDPAEVDEMEANMLARQADERAGCWCLTQTPTCPTAE